MDDHALAEFFGRYVGWALEIYGRAKQGAEAVAPYNPFATAPFSAVNALARWLSQPPPPPYEAGPGAYEPPYEVPAPPAAPNEEGDVADLRREVEALKKLVKQAKR
jgi:hypothetical protein